MKCLAVASLVTCFLPGCGGRSVDPHVEDLVTIRTGIYGQVTSVNDVGDTDSDYVRDFGVDVFQVPAATELGAPIAHTASAGRGFYQLEIEPADYVVCSAFRRCVRITVGDQPLRLDYEISVGPGWSTGTTWVPQAGPKG